ncbi:MAG: NYN domain-containing protein, partial [Erysipelotrichaceae bacterium]|nr:NYN domain-containing protein [Erysipelotrichaceae bacterium]
RELSKTYKVIVFTSDALEQLSVFSAEATRLSSREFLSRYQNMKKNMTHIEKASIRPLEALRTLLEDD